MAAANNSGLAACLSVAVVRDTGGAGGTGAVWLRHFRTGPPPAALRLPPVSLPASSAGDALPEGVLQSKLVLGDGSSAAVQCLVWNQSSPSGGWVEDTSSAWLGSAQERPDSAAAQARAASAPEPCRAPLRKPLATFPAVQLPPPPACRSPFPQRSHPHALPTQNATDLICRLGAGALPSFIQVLAGGDEGEALAWVGALLFSGGECAPSSGDPDEPFRQLHKGFLNSPHLADPGLALRCAGRHTRCLHSAPKPGASRAAACLGLRAAAAAACTRASLPLHCRPSLHARRSIARAYVGAADALGVGACLTVAVLDEYALVKPPVLEQVQVHTSRAAQPGSAPLAATPAAP